MASQSSSQTRRRWYRFIQWLARNLVFRPFGGFQVLHEERVPMHGALIVAPYHVSFADPALVGCLMRRELYFLAKEELFVGPFGALIRSVNSFPVRRGVGDTEAMRKTLELLREEKAVLMFPEGTRGDGVTMGAISPGIAMLAKRSRTKILPVGIVGTHRLLPKGAKFFRRSKCTLIYGEPFEYEEVAGEGSERERRERFASALGERIAKLCAEGGLLVRTSPYTRGSTSSDLGGKALAEPTPAPSESA